MSMAADKDKHILFTSIRLMICVGHADGYLGKKEINRVYQMVEGDHFTLRERQILMDDIDNPQRLETIVADLGPLSRAEKIHLLKHLYQIALADHKLSQAERNIIRKIANLLGIEEEKLQQVEEWMMDGVTWKERWRQIVGE